MAGQDPSRRLFPCRQTAKSSSSFDWNTASSTCSCSRRSSSSSIARILDQTAGWRSASQASVSAKSMRLATACWYNTLSGEGAGMASVHTVPGFRGTKAKLWHCGQS